MRFRFGDHEIDEDRFLLRRCGARVSVRPKVFDLLVVLVRHRRRVVRREELIAALWASTTVGPGALSGLINELRQVLGESGTGPSAIRTVHGRGYQFVGVIECAETAEEEAESRADRDWLERALARHGLSTRARDVTEALIAHVRDDTRCLESIVGWLTKERGLDASEPVAEATGTHSSRVMRRVEPAASVRARRFGPG